MDGPIKRYNIWKTSLRGRLLGSLYTFSHKEFEKSFIDLLQNDFMHVYRSSYRTNPGWPKVWY